ncbi:hypothetical protein JTE90_020116 [Oedothorax gibbosus]|uniref:LanC-like protein 3 homolog n=1 Tax=Oedothorax gibbosus TaxID=931172 RepID=A0AAV6VMR4_9ARAC|nr:hypothetical protein JTE90_020116 [Oedothorax gibbosus]
MSRSSRYFINNLKDFAPDQSIKIPIDAIKNQCLKYMQQISDQQTLSTKDCDGSLYVGLAGVSYAFYHLSQNPEFVKDRQDLLSKSWHYLQPALSHAEKGRNRRDSAFLLGSGGVYATAAAVMKALGREKECNEYVEKYAAMADGCMEGDYLGCGSDEILVGRAGYLAGILFLQRVLGKQVLPSQKIHMLCETIVDSGTKYSRQHHSNSPLMYAYHGTEYFGAAHGTSGIFQMLLCFPYYLDSNPTADKRLKESVDYLLSTQTKSGNFPSSADEVERPRKESSELVHWCHGAPGIVYLMAKAYQRWKEDKYLQSCLQCGEVTWTKGLLCKGPGICHGVAGSGYVFLLLHRLTGDALHLHRAIEFAKFMETEEFIRGARTPDMPLSLYEGIAGTMCFVADLLRPEQAHFPFSDVF